MATMNISLPSEMVDFVKHAILKREIDVGIAAAAAGRFSSKRVSEIANEVLNEPR